VNGISAYRRVLRNRALRRLLIGETVSSIGDWLYLVAILVIVYEITADPVVLGIVGAARLVPFVLLSVPAGIAADRFDRRMILLVTDIARGALMLVLAVLVSTDAPVILIVGAAMAAACFSSFFGPAIGAYLPAIVGDERDLGPANSLWATLDNLAYFIGPAIAGLLIAAGGLGFAFLLNAASFAFVGVILLSLPPGRPGGPAPDAEGGDDGSRQAAPTPSTAPAWSRSELLRRIGGPVLVDAATSASGMALSILLVLVAIDQLEAGPQAVGYLEAATGVGGVIAGVLAGWFVAKRLDGPLIGSAIVGAGGLIGLAVTDSLPVALVVVGIAMGSVLIMDIVVTTLVQRLIPDELRGRAMGMMQLTGVSASLAGSLLAPILASWLGLQVVLTGMGVLLVAAALAAVFVLTRQRALQARTDIDPHRVGLLRGTILVGAPAARLESAAMSLVEVPVAVGDVVIRQGDPSDRFYLIAEGRFSVTQVGAAGQAVQLREIGPADPFGEIGLLTGGPRTATVTALSDGRLFALDRDEFLSLVGSGPGLSSGLLDVYRGSMSRAGSASGSW
jgi:CRP-like cAMP-binding protein/predicted MFS family arabinose efflux permease